MYFVYILKSRVAKKTYVGISDNPERRLIEHNNGRSFYTKRYKPWEIVCIEQFESRDEARKREKYLKTASGRKNLRRFFDNHSGACLARSPSGESSGSSNGNIY